MEALFGFDLWDVAIVLVLIVGLFLFIASVEKSKRRGEEKRNR